MQKRVSDPEKRQDRCNLIRLNLNWSTFLSFCSIQQPIPIKAVSLPCGIFVPHWSETRSFHSITCNKATISRVETFSHLVSIRDSGEASAGWCDISLVWPPARRQHVRLRFSMALLSWSSTGWSCCHSAAPQPLHGHGGDTVTCCQGIWEEDNLTVFKVYIFIDYLLNLFYLLIIIIICYNNNNNIRIPLNIWFDIWFDLTAVRSKTHQYVIKIQNNIFMTLIVLSNCFSTYRTA